jgi:hypothetical protein
MEGARVDCMKNQEQLPRKGRHNPRLFSHPYLLFSLLRVIHNPSTFSYAVARGKVALGAYLPGVKTAGLLFSEYGPRQPEIQDSTPYRFPEGEPDNYIWKIGGNMEVSVRSTPKFGKIHYREHMYSITNAISEPIGNTRYCITFQMADAQ